MKIECNEIEQKILVAYLLGSAISANLSSPVRGGGGGGGAYGS